MSTNASADRLRVEEEHAERVAQVGDAPQLVAPRRRGPGAVGQALGGVEVG
jgi:hypothetical protein